MTWKRLSFVEACVIGLLLGILANSRIHTHAFRPGTCEIGSYLIAADHTMYACLAPNSWTEAK
jgi:hypothetical protein